VAHIKDEPTGSVIEEVDVLCLISFGYHLVETLDPRCEFGAGRRHLAHAQHNRAIVGVDHDLAGEVLQRYASGGIEHDVLARAAEIGGAEALRHLGVVTGKSDRQSSSTPGTGSRMPGVVGIDHPTPVVAAKHSRRVDGRFTNLQDARRVIAFALDLEWVSLNLQSGNAAEISFHDHAGYRRSASDPEDLVQHIRTVGHDAIHSKVNEASHGHSLIDRPDMHVLLRRVSSIDEPTGDDP
jgi:hypothetical protein